MHYRSWFVALLGACALFVLAPPARADGFYVTFTKVRLRSPRLVGAVFGSTGQVPVDPMSGLVTGQLRITPVHIEVDNLPALVPLLTAATNIQSFGAHAEGRVRLRQPNRDRERWQLEAILAKQHG